MNETNVPVMGVRLRKDGEHIVVDVKIKGAWIEVIRELSDGKICHIVEPAGIWSRFHRWELCYIAEWTEIEKARREGK